MSDDVTAVLVALAREQLAVAQNILVEIVIDAGNLHARIETVVAEHHAS